MKIKDVSIIPVVFSSDHNFIMPTYVAIYSMLRNSSSKCKIFLLVADDVTEEDKSILLKLSSEYGSEIVFIPIGDIFDHTFCIRGISKATYFRLLIPWIIPDYDKVIYLDGDIVVTGDITELYQWPIINDNLICGVRTPNYSTNRNLRNRISKEGLDYNEYINAGILIINSKELRKEEFKQIFLSHIGKKYYFQDQDILNITCKGRIGFLPLKFNYGGVIWPKIEAQFIAGGLATSNEVKEAVCSPVIVHYAGAKPWKAFTNRWNDWVEYYKETPFYNQTLIDRISFKTLYPAFNLKKTIKCLLKRP